MVIVIILQACGLFFAAIGRFDVASYVVVSACLVVLITLYEELIENKKEL